MPMTKTSDFYHRISQNTIVFHDERKKRKESTCESNLYLLFFSNKDVMQLHPIKMHLSKTINEMAISQFM